MLLGRSPVINESGGKNIKNPSENTTFFSKRSARCVPCVTSETAFEQTLCEHLYYVLLRCQSFYKFLFIDECHCEGVPFDTVRAVSTSVRDGKLRTGFPKQSPYGEEVCCIDYNPALFATLIISNAYSLSTH